MKKLTKDVEKEIAEYIENNQPMVYWDNENVGIEGIKEILAKGLDEYFEELWESNIDYIWDTEQYFVKEIQKEWDGYDPDEIEEFSKDFIHVDLDRKGLINNIPSLTCMAYVYSNYDCCNSMDRFEDDGYLPEVFERVKAGVLKKDYMDEFHNGAYGGCIFAFAFKTDIESLLEMEEKIKYSGKKILIPKGTQFGFFSSFQGAGTMFKHVTHKDMELPLYGETEYDSINVEADITQSYNMSDVYGDTNFIEGCDVEIK